MASIKCPNCGKFIRSGSSYCIMCGATLRNLDSDEGNEPDIEETPTEKKEPPQMQRMSSLNQPASKPMYAKTPKNAVPTAAPVETFQKPEKEEFYEDMEDLDSDEMNDFLQEDEDMAEDAEYDNDEIVEDDEENQDEDAFPEDEEEDEDEDPEDDEEAFARLLNGTKDTPESKKDKKEKIDNKKIPSAAINNLKKNLMGFDNSAKLKRNKAKKTQNVAVEEDEDVFLEDEDDELLYEDETVAEIDKDKYYDDIISEVDKRISHIKKDNLVHAISVVAVFIVIIVFMIYCVVL